MFPATDPFPLLGFKETLSLSQNWISEFSGWGNGKRNLLHYMDGIGEIGRRRRFLLQTLKEVDDYLREKLSMTTVTGMSHAIWEEKEVSVLVLL
ncbi:hypothetical protein CDAR_105411 [Caerostris darwini]|uniref:Uncharacterized protein n=1 Tax=Caerostris darwini TaxID=1538125 RepID=A0AAV4MXE1_9ARAC|nr:hypothetical protein CDAR_105411 [Caerostris darwini]